MITVFRVTKEGLPPTRLHLPGSLWGFRVQEKLVQMGHTVQETDQDHLPDLRDEAELARRDELLESTGL